VSKAIGNETFHCCIYLHVTKSSEVVKKFVYSEIIPSNVTCICDRLKFRYIFLKGSTANYKNIGAPDRSMSKRIQAPNSYPTAREHGTSSDLFLPTVALVGGQNFRLFFISPTELQTKAVNVFI
jgi:hypothetical protein